MTIEEAAKKRYPDIISFNGYGYAEYNEIARNGFIEGANWMLEKANNEYFDFVGRPTNSEKQF